MSRRTDEAVVGQLLAVAERVYGEKGLSAVSLRQIRLEAGSGNKNAIQYHFGDADGLVRAILYKRIPEVEHERAGLLLQVEAEGLLNDTRSLMTVLYQPLLQHKDANGNRTFARFNLALLNSHDGAKWGQAFLELQPSAVRVIDLLIRATGIPARLLMERQRLVSIMVLTSTFNRQEPYDDVSLDAALIDNVLAMAAAAIEAPIDGGSTGMLAPADLAYPSMESMLDRLTSASS
jgi:AcrR family transcriptional regulator